MTIEIFGVEGSDVERQVFQLEVSEEQVKLACTSYDAEDEAEGLLASSYLSAGLMADIVDVVLDFVVSEFDRFVGRDMSSQSREYVGKAIAQNKILLESASHSAVVLGSVEEEADGLDNCLDMQLVNYKVRLVVRRSLGMDVCPATAVADDYTLDESPAEDELALE